MCLYIIYHRHELCQACPDVSSEAHSSAGGGLYPHFAVGSVYIEGWGQWALDLQLPDLNAGSSAATDQWQRANPLEEYRPPTDPSMTENCTRRTYFTQVICL